MEIRFLHAESLTVRNAACWLCLYRQDHIRTLSYLTSFNECQAKYFALVPAGSKEKDERLKTRSERVCSGRHLQLIIMASKDDLLRMIIDSCECKGRRVMLLETK